MKLNRVISMAIIVIVLAVMAPVALDALVDTSINRYYDEDFVAVEDGTTPETIVVAHFPYTAASETVTVNLTPTTAFSATPTTGTIILDAAESVVDDEIAVNYEGPVDTGLLATIWDFLPILAGVAVLLIIVGLIRQRRGGG